MKISIITVTLNSEKTVRDTLNSVFSQSYKKIEHIIVDGGSKDNTISIIKNYKFKNKKIFIKKKLGVYESINYGISKSAGDYIIILNSDDFFQSNNTIQNIIKQITINKSYDIFLGNVAYFDDLDYYRVTRFYSSKNFKRWKMKLGLMPPHPASIISKKVYKKYGAYTENFKIAGDFEFFLRIFYKNKIRYKIINETIVRMRSGGISGKNLLSYWISTLEILKSFKINKIYTNFIFILMRIPVKINQLFFFNSSKINLSFKLFNILFDNEHYLKSSFKVLKKLIKFLSKIILSYLA